MNGVCRSGKTNLFGGGMRETACACEFNRPGGIVGRLLCLILAVCLGAAAVSRAGEGFVTATFGSDAKMQYPQTLKFDQDLMRFDVSALPRGVEIQRARLRFPFRSDWGGHSAVKLAPIGVSKRPLRTFPPAHRSLDATEAVRAWVESDEANRGLRIVQGGRVQLEKAVLEVSYRGPVRASPAEVTELKAEHRDGQTFLTWREPQDIVGKDGPAFEEFEKAVLDARARRRIVYRVYRYEQPITPANLGQAELAAEVPEVISSWNLLAIANTEHPQKDITKRSPLRSGNLRLAHTMTRYRLSDDEPPLRRATGLAVLTARQRGRYYYAVTVSVDGREAVDKLTTGQSLIIGVDEQPAEFPAIVYQRTQTAKPEQKNAPEVDVYVCWLEPPLVHASRAVEVYMVRWPDIPRASALRRPPLYVNLGTYGCSATEMGNPGWHAARRHVSEAVTIGLSEEGKLWAGDHECLGTLRGLDEGVVWNHEQRRVLASTAWALAKTDLFIDPQRVYIWGQFAGWALRHGDIFAAVMSNGHNNMKTSREGRKHYWRWGRPDHGKNWLGMNHLDYLDLAAWVRENPKVELPYWVCWPAYGAFPDHSLGDFGFKPWQDFIEAMKQTRRAFSAVWMSNGPGLARGVCRDMVPQIKLDQSLPAFSNCSLDTSPYVDKPRGSYRPGRYDEDFQKYADKEEGINLYQRWDPNGIIDEPEKWAVTAWLAAPDKQGRFGSPAQTATMDITPRRCRRFTAEPGAQFQWTNTSKSSGRLVGSGSVAADKWGLVTIRQVKIGRSGNRIVIKRR